jgi:hypothetical protein
MLVNLTVGYESVAGCEGVEMHAGNFKIFNFNFNI